MKRLLLVMSVILVLVFGMVGCATTDLFDQASEAGSVVPVAQLGDYSIVVVKDEMGGSTNLVSYELQFMLNGAFQFKHLIQLNTSADGTVEYVNGQPAMTTALDQFNGEIDAFNWKIRNFIGSATPNFRLELDTLLYALELALVDIDGVLVPQVKRK